MYDSEGEMMRGREDSPKKKMNQRLFKRLILYYNVSIRKKAQQTEYSQNADSAPSDP